MSQSRLTNKAYWFNLKEVLDDFFKAYEMAILIHLSCWFTAGFAFGCARLYWGAGAWSVWGMAITYVLGGVETAFYILMAVIEFVASVKLGRLSSVEEQQLRTVVYG